MRRTTCVWIAAAAVLAAGASCRTTETASTPARPAPLDARLTVPGDVFERRGNAEWLSPESAAPFPFEELIYSWQIRLPEKEGFRLHLQVAFAGGETSPWLYAGFWGKVKPVAGKRENPKFEHGEVDLDHLKLRKKAVAFRFKVIDEGDVPLTRPPALHVVVTDNRPPPEFARRFAPARPAGRFEPRILDLPLRKQQDSKGTPTPNRCQSAAVATAMQYFGRTVPLEAIIPWTHDPEYEFEGIWPRTLGAAAQNGFEARIDRFRDWEAVKAAIARNEVILASIRMPKGMTCKEPPYSSIGGHIVAVNGWTADGRVVITDSALARKDEGHLCQWLMEDFEKVWMVEKGGVGMVILPPDGAKPVLHAAPLPDLPKGRAPRRDARNAARRPAEKALETIAKDMPPEQRKAFEEAFWAAWDAEYERTGDVKPPGDLRF